MNFRAALQLVPVLGLLAGTSVTPSAHWREGPRARRLRVVTYNVHLGEALIGERNGGSRSIERAFATEAALRGVDVLGVQELCSNEGGWQLAYFDRLMRESGGASWRAIALSDPVGRMMCGRVEAIYSRFPIVASGAITLPQVNEPRSAVWADLEVPEPDGHVRLVRVYNAHLENRALHMPSAEGRLEQVRVILRHLDAWRRTHPDAPVLLLGDLNTLGRLWDFWRPEATLFDIASHHLAPSLRTHAHTLTLLPHQIDWIFSDGLRLEDSKVVHVWLSDHFPVVADYAWPKPPALAAAPRPKAVTE